MSGCMLIPSTDSTHTIHSHPHHRAWVVNQFNNGGIIRYRLGRIKYGYDYLFPAMDNTMDVCVYVMAPSFTRHEDCPYFAFEANGRPRPGQYIAHCYAPATWRDTSGDIPYVPQAFNTGSHYISTTYRYTDKLASTDYESYDPQLHRRAGVTGSLALEDLGAQSYGSLPHGSVFYFDNANNHPPSFSMLLATYNIKVNGVALRHTSLSYTDDIHWGSIRDGDYSTHVAGDLKIQPYNYTTQGLGWTFYVRPYTVNDTYPQYYRVFTHPLAQIVVDGDVYKLQIITFDATFWSTGSLQWATFESPLIQVDREDTTLPGKCFILDEAVTIHRPFVY